MHAGRKTRVQIFVKMQFLQCKTITFNCAILGVVMLCEKSSPCHEKTITSYISGIGRALVIGVAEKNSRINWVTRASNEPLLVSLHDRIVGSSTSVLAGGCPEVDCGIISKCSVSRWKAR